MSEIKIPPAALEAGTDIIRDYRKAGVTSDRIARAAFLAMIENWEGMEIDDGQYGGDFIILPLPHEASDDQ